MKQEYYKANERVFCFGSSVANLLLEIGDSVAAKKAYENASSVSVGNTKGWFLDILTGRTFRELTEDKYVCEVTLWQTAPIEETLRKLVKSPQFDQLERAVHEEIAEGHLKFVDNPRMLKVYAPGILFMEDYTMKKQHAILLRNSKNSQIFVDGGHLKTIEEIKKDWPINYGTLSNVRRRT